MNEFIDRLKHKLNKSLPGHDAHKLMMPLEGTNARFDESRMKKARLSSVLILFYKKNNEIYFPLTQRQDYGGTHSGQVSFPGGKWEETDLDLIHTAKREAFEEIGIEDEKIEIIGQLTDLFIPPSNFRVTPVVAFAHEPPTFVIDTYEVKELLEVPLKQLLNSQTVKRKDITFSSGFKLNAPYFDIGGKVVWGATAMMLSELVSIIKSVE
jgi:8-oxo-dGTP pyrophosphatase MutT (NUDIX family)